MIPSLLAATIILLIVWIAIRPSNERDWSPDQALLPWAEFQGDQVTIRNIRNFTYASTTEYIPAYYDAVFDLKKIKSVDYVVEPFSAWAGSAHTFLTFGFADQQYVSISIEIRKEKGERFSAWKGLFKQFEIMYVIADEQDVIKLRSNFRRDQIFLYPIKAAPEKIAALFIDMLQGANRLKEQPEFYNTVTNTCATKIADHVNAVSPGRIPWSYKLIFPGYSDELAYQLGLIDTDLPFTAIRRQYQINDRAERYADAPDFSVKIRQFAPE